MMHPVRLQSSRYVFLALVFSTIKRRRGLFALVWDRTPSAKFAVPGMNATIMLKDKTIYYQLKRSLVRLIAGCNTQKLSNTSLAYSIS